MNDGMTPAEFERMRRRHEVRDDHTWARRRDHRWTLADLAAWLFLAACAGATAAITWSTVR